jgi:hypothetical protein
MSTVTPLGAGRARSAVAATAFMPVPMPSLMPSEIPEDIVAVILRTDDVGTGPSDSPRLGPLVEVLERCCAV